MPDNPLGVNIRLRGMADLQRKLMDTGQNIKPDLERATTRAILYVQSQIPPYPSQNPETTYRRTGTLGRLITAFPGKSQGRNVGGISGGRKSSGADGESTTRVETRGSNIVGIIGTTLRYAIYVIGDVRAAYMSAWWTLTSVVYGAFPGVKQIYQDMVTDLRRRFE